MNLKGLTKEQQKYLIDWLEMQVFDHDAPVIIPLMESSLGRIAANLIRKQNAEMEACGYRPDQRMSDPGKFDAGRITAGLYAVRGVCGGIRTDDLDHVIDWLKASVLASAPWLHRVDGEGRPLKLMKCSTIADLVREADKSMDRLNAQRAKALGPDDERHVADLADGYTLVQLLTPEALDLESSRMHHCVGHGAYDDEVASGRTEIYSLRDPMGRPVVTIETCRFDSKTDQGWKAYRKIEQVQGKRNDDPSDEHLAILKPFILASGWEGENGYWPRVKDIAGTVHDLYAIPAGARFKDLEVYGYGLEHGDLSLPEGLTVDGELKIDAGWRRIEIGERTTVGSLRLEATRDSSGMVLPESLQVAGEISVPADDDGIVCVPEHLASKVRMRKGLRSLHEAVFGAPRYFFRREGAEQWETLPAGDQMTQHSDGRVTLPDGSAVAEARYEFSELDPRPFRWQPRREPFDPDIAGYQRAMFANFLRTARGETWDPIFEGLEMGIERDGEELAAPSP